MKMIKKILPQFLKNIYHFAKAVAANIFYGFPSGKIKIIGVTGTDGKTTTTQMISKIFEEAGKSVAMASTINFVINGKEDKNLSHYTTESAFAVQKFIKKAVQARCEYLILETSSHSLDQHRVWGVRFQTAVVTNVTREHLDYHKTMERYRDAKKKLFKMTTKNGGTIIVNLDMDNPEDFLNFEAGKKYGYTTKVQNIKSGTENLEIIKAEDVELEISFSKFRILGSAFILKIPGMFNVENALAASCVGLSEDIEMETIKEALAKIKGVPGRMEAIENDLGANIFIDFALTPNALEKLYGTLSRTKKDAAKIISVFGSCGDRDRGKRPIIGEIVSRYADIIILTNDEPYHEEPIKIIEEIASGIRNKKENEDFWKIPDRREAIKKALKMAKAGDIVCITGMGNFETMVVGDEKIPWDDRQVVREELKKLQ